MAGKDPRQFVAIGAARYGPAPFVVRYRYLAATPQRQIAHQ
jgi:hypothetical protein